MAGVCVRVGVRRFSEVHWEAILRVGELAQGTHTSVRTPRLQVMLPRGQKSWEISGSVLGGPWLRPGVNHSFGSRKEEAA